MAQITSLSKRSFLTLNMLLLVSYNMTASESQLSVSASITKFQDLHLRALRQLDTIESILDTIGQSLASGASNLSEKKKTLIQIQLTQLHKAVSSIKDSAAVHVDQSQLCSLTLINEEITRVLLGTVNSGLVVIPQFKEENLIRRSSSEFSLDALEKSLNENQNKLTKLTQLSERIGLTKLNQIYRSMRKTYKKYHVWPIIEHTAVYTMFAHWLIFVIPKYAIEALAKKKGWTGDFGRWALKERKWLGDAPFDKKDDRIVDAHLYEVNETGHLQHANPQIFISKGNGRPPIPFDKESPDIRQRGDKNRRSSGRGGRSIHR